jgi:hypothetical protein
MRTHLRFYAESKLGAGGMWDEKRMPVDSFLPMPYDR